MSYPAYKHVKIIHGNRLRKSFSHRWVGVKLVKKGSAVRPFIYFKNNHGWVACRYRVAVENVEGIFPTLTAAVLSTLGEKT